MEQEFEDKLAQIDQLQSRCTHCGICSEGCATFQLTGWEHESPRGRLQLAESFIQGKISLDSKELSTFDHCLGCRSCEISCPHQVSYSRVRDLVQDIRSHLQMIPLSAMTRREYRKWIRLFHRISHVWWRRLAGKWLSIPSIPFKSLGSFAKKQTPIDKAKPILAVCCVQDLFQHETIQQMLMFFQRLGIPLQVDRNQPCCGAIFNRLVHGGEETVCYPKEKSRINNLQIKTKKDFLKWKPDQTFFLSRGCQAFISDKDEAMDLYAWIETILDSKNLILELAKEMEIYYQPYCAYSKREKDSIWRLLHRIKGLKIREFSQNSCCGGYCGEALFHSERANKIILKKTELLPSNASIVVASPDCWHAFKSIHVDGGRQVLYPIQIFSRADLRLKKNK